MSALPPPRACLLPLPLSACAALCRASKQVCASPQSTPHPFLDPPPQHHTEPHSYLQVGLVQRFWGVGQFEHSPAPVVPRAVIVSRAVVVAGAVVVPGAIIIPRAVVVPEHRAQHTQHNSSDCMLDRFAQTTTTTTQAPDRADRTYRGRSRSRSRSSLRQRTTPPKCQVQTCSMSGVGDAISHLKKGSTQGGRQGRLHTVRCGQVP